MPRTDIVVLTSIIIAMSAMQFGTDIYMPSMPGMAKELITSSALIQLTVSIYLGFGSISQLIYGPCSDRYGRRKIMLFGIGCLVIGGVACFCAQTVSQLLIARSIQGCGAGAVVVSARAMLKDHFSGATMAKAASLLGLFMTLIPSIAPALGGYIDEYFGWRMVFVFLSSYTLIVLLIIWHIQPETNQVLDSTATKPKKVINNYWHVFCNKTFQLNMLAASASYSGLIAYATATPFTYQEVLNLTPGENGNLAILTGIALMLGMTFNGRFVGKWGINVMLKLGVMIQVIGAGTMLAIAMADITSVLVIVLPFLVFAFGSSLIFPNTMVGALEPFTKITGVASALYGCLQIFLTSIITSVVSHLPEMTQLPLAWVLVALGLVNVICIRNILRG